MSESTVSVLLIEDNPIHARLLRGLLDDIRSEHFQVEAVETLQEGLNRLARGGVDVVLLDLVLPDSQELVTFVHVRAYAPEVPIIVLTGLDDMELAARAVRAGAQDYLVKTQINSTILARSIHHAIEHGSAHRREWDSPLFRLAQERFLKAAHLLDLDPPLEQRLLFPARAQVVSLPFHRDRDSREETLFGYRVQHSTWLGPTLGGTRYQEDLALGSVSALAMEKTWQCALLELPYGGAQGGVRVDPEGLSHSELHRLTREYARGIGGTLRPGTDVVTPDAGTDEQVMAWLLDTYSGECGALVADAVAGKPVVLGGLPEFSRAPARSLLYVVEAAARELGLELDGATAVVRGFEGPGGDAARLLSERGVRIIAAGVASGGVHRGDGLDVDAVARHLAQQGALKGLPEGEAVTLEELAGLSCDLLVATDAEDRITARNADQVRCRIVVEGAPGASSMEADELLSERGILVLPDVLTTAGSAVAAHFECRAAADATARDVQALETRLRKLVTEAFGRAHARAQELHMDLRTACLTQSLERVRQIWERRGLAEADASA